MLKLVVEKKEKYSKSGDIYDLESFQDVFNYIHDDGVNQFSKILIFDDEIEICITYRGFNEKNVTLNDSCLCTFTYRNDIKYIHYETFNDVLSFLNDITIADRM